MPGEFHGQRSLVGYSPWGCKESDTTEQLHFHFHSAYNFSAWLYLITGPSGINYFIPGNIKTKIWWVTTLMYTWVTVQFSRSVMSNSLWPHEPQHARPPCPSPTTEVHPNPCPLSRWCHPTISSSAIPFSPCPQSFIRIFSNESALRIRWPKYWSFSLTWVTRLTYNFCGAFTNSGLKYFSMITHSPQS